jgi:hypothetical protein
MTYRLPDYLYSLIPVTGAYASIKEFNLHAATGPPISSPSLKRLSIMSRIGRAFYKIDPWDEDKRCFLFDLPLIGEAKPATAATHL